MNKTDCARDINIIYLAKRTYDYEIYHNALKNVASYKVLCEECGMKIDGLGNSCFSVTESAYGCDHENIGKKTFIPELFQDWLWFYLNEFYSSEYEECDCQECEDPNYCQLSREIMNLENDVLTQLRELQISSMQSRKKSAN